jgi:glucans biosynthesis protein
MALQTSRGRFTDYRLVEAVPDGVPGHWRAQFDLAEVSGPEPVELRLQLTVDGKVASETWMFQLRPLAG